MGLKNLQSEIEQTYNQVYSNSYSIDELINPSDVTDGAETWGDVERDDLEKEIENSVTVKNHEGQYDSERTDLAITIWMSSMSRIKLEDVVFDSVYDALKNGYWPYSTNMYEAENMIKEMVWNDDLGIPKDAQEQASNVITSAYIDKLDPNSEKGDSL